MAETVTLPVLGMERHRLATDGLGVTTLVGGYGCPLKCKYCINAYAWDPKTLSVCKNMTPEELYEALKIDDLYFKATGGGVTFGGGESLLHAKFIKAFRKLCPDWSITVETSLNVPEENLKTVLESVDEFIVDIKDMNPEIYREYTSLSNERVLHNLAILAGKVGEKRIKIRVPAIPNGNTQADRESSVAKLLALGFENIELFEYVIFHKAAQS